MNARIRRSERLKSKRAIDRLFKEGHRIRGSNFTLLFHTEPGDGGIRISVGVPKKKMRKAHDRNRTKRVLREVFRLNKNDISTVLAEKGLSADLFLLYKENALPSSSKVRDEMIRIIRRFKEKLDREEKGENAGS